METNLQKPQKGRIIHAQGNLSTPIDAKKNL
jgi:hypothetical protein